MNNDNYRERLEFIFKDLEETYTYDDLDRHLNFYHKIPHTDSQAVDYMYFCLLQIVIGRSILKKYNNPKFRKAC